MLGLALSDELREALTDDDGDGLWLALWLELGDEDSEDEGEALGEADRDALRLLDGDAEGL